MSATHQFHIIFVSVNAIALGPRARTRDAIGAVRHVFLDADDDASAVLSRIDARTDLPNPSYVLYSSPNHAHVFWRVSGFDRDLVERLQKHLARELQTDPAATPVTQNTRLPGFLYLKSPVAWTPRAVLCSQGVGYAAVTDSGGGRRGGGQPRSSSFSPSASFFGRPKGGSRTVTV